jgi:hypothetical protein
VPGPEPQLVLLCGVGNLWPLDAPAVKRRVDEYRADPRFGLMVDGPTFVFRRKASSTADPRR